MEQFVKEIKKGIKVHILNTDKFKTNLFAMFLTKKLTREDVTKNALISMILRRGSSKMKSQEEISKKMEELYGASFDCGIDKTGDIQVLKFYIESINDNYLPHTNENTLKIIIGTLLDIAFNPYIENEGFKEEYLEQEKNNLKRRVEGKKDNKARYAIERCTEEMYKDKPFGLYKFGYIEDLDKIDGKNLYKYYKELIDTCKIDIFLSGNVGEDAEKLIDDNENIKSLKERTPDCIFPKNEDKEVKEENVVTEKMDVSQGKLVIGLDVNLNDDKQKYFTLLYNSLLGGSANSKLFQNVREKANLAYVASSSYLRYKNIIFINSGIEISNYEKALNLIKEQIEDMKQGKFTDEEIEENKKVVISAIKTIGDEQDTEVIYYFGQELTGVTVSVNDYVKIIENIKKEDILDVANRVSINTIYFLRD